jgi:cancer susceptibility candidate protein 1
LSKKEKAKLEAEQAETLRIEMEKERLKKLEEDRERKMRERRDAKKKQEQEAVENKIRRVQLRSSAHVFKSENIFLDPFHVNLFFLSLRDRVQRGNQTSAGKREARN